MDRAVIQHELDAAGKKNEKNSDALDTGGPQAVIIDEIPSLERFQVYIQMGSPGPDNS